MDKSEKKQNYSSKKSSEKKYNHISSRTMKTPTNIFKQSKKFVKYKTNRTYLNTVYLESRDRYQKYVTNENNSEGLKFMGNKLYENLPVSKFKDDYIINTFNISKELENKILGYFSPLNKIETSREKKFDGEKISLTPIPFKKADYIHNKVEGKKIQEIKRSSVFMRRVEYTHLIQNFQPKNIEKKNNNINNNANLVKKIAVLKGATLIIEDWWKKIKRKRTEAEIKNRIGLKDFEKNKDDISNKIKVTSENNESKENRQNNQLKENEENQIIKFNKLNSESGLINKSNQYEKINLNIKNIKLNNNNKNLSELINKVFDNENNSEINESDIINHSKTTGIGNENIYKKNKLSEKEKDDNINSSMIEKKIVNKKEIINSNNKKINDLNKSTKIESIDKIKLGIFNNLNNNNLIKKKKNNKNVLSKKSTNDHTSLKNSMSLIENNQELNNMNNSKKRRHTSQLIYNLNDIEKFKDPSNSYLAIIRKKKKSIKTNLNKELELANKNNSDKNKKDNNLENNDYKNNYNTVNNINIKSNNKKNENNIKNESKLTRLNNINMKKNKNVKIKEIFIDLDKNDDDNNKNNINKINDYINSANNNENPNNDNIIRNEDEKINIKNIENKNKLIQDNIIEDKKKNQEEVEKIKKIENKKINNFKYKKPNINNKEIGNKIINKKREKSNDNILKSQEFSFSINQNYLKKFDNLKIISNNENFFIYNSKSQIIDNNLDFENISNHNYNSSNSKQYNSPFSLVKEIIESRNQLDENNIINNEIDDSEIIPVEPDNQKNFILTEFLKRKINKNENDNLILTFNNSKLRGKNILNKSKRNNKIINSNNNNINLSKSNKIYKSSNNNINLSNSNNNINLSKNKNYENELSKSEIIINVPKTVKNNNIRESKNKYNNNNKIKYNSEHNNSIEIKNFIDIKEKYNTNIIYIGGNPENHNLSNNKKRRRFININSSMSVPKHIKEMHKLYRTNSAKEIKRKKDKRFEYVRSLHDKFEFEF